MQIFGTQWVDEPGIVDGSLAWYLMAELDADLFWEIYCVS